MWVQALEDVQKYYKAEGVEIVRLSPQERAEPGDDRREGPGQGRRGARRERPSRNGGGEVYTGTGTTVHEVA